MTFTVAPVGDIRALPYVSGPVYRVELGQIGGSERFDRVVFGGTEQFDNLEFNLVTTPESALAELLHEVTGVGPGKSLAMKITHAQAYYAVPDIQATCAMLTAFVNEVEAQAGKKISQATAVKLIADAQAIVAAIGCNQVASRGLSEESPSGRAELRLIARRDLRWSALVDALGVKNARSR